MHAFCFHNTCIKQPNRQNQVVQTPSSQWVEFRDLRSHYSCITNTYTWIIITTSVFLCITSELSLKWMVWHFSFSCSSCGWLLKDGYTAHNWITSHNIIPWQAMFTWKIHISSGAVLCVMCLTSISPTCPYFSYRFFQEDPLNKDTGDMMFFSVSRSSAYCAPYKRMHIQ